MKTIQKVGNICILSLGAVVLAFLFACEAWAGLWLLNEAVGLILN
jgi:hypothetical protein